MGFSPEIKIEAFVASARHCSVCHRYKGVKVEVHHIVQEADGGSNDFDNAIPLCFDCHADAGHYNPKHPRGSKFSPKELRIQRDNWYRFVKNNNVDIADGSDRLYVRYLVCKSFEVAFEVSTLDFSRFPAEDVFFVKNDIFNFQQCLINSQNTKQRKTDLFSASYRDSDYYEKIYPNAVKTEKGSTSFPYFEYLRPVTKDIIETKILSHSTIDGATKFLVDQGIPKEKLLKIIAFHPGECVAESPEEIHEYFVFRPIWFVYLAATNISTEYLKIDSLWGTFEKPNSIAYRNSQNDEINNFNSTYFPQAAVPPKGTIIIPIATALAPFSAAAGKVLSSESASLSIAQWQQVNHVAFNEAFVEELDFLKPTIWPIEIQGKESGSKFSQPIHFLDFSNLYTIDRHWSVGSCPHLFFKYKGSAGIVYIGELFSKPGITTTDRLCIPAAVEELIIAELEYETTYIEEVSINGSVVARGNSLQHGDDLRLTAIPGQSVTLIGRYYLDHEETNFNHGKLPSFKNELVASFMSQFR